MGKSTRIDLPISSRQTRNRSRDSAGIRGTVLRYLTGSIKVSHLLVHQSIDNVDVRTEHFPVFDDVTVRWCSLYRH